MNFILFLVLASILCLSLHVHAYVRTNEGYYFMTSRDGEYHLHPNGDMTTALTVSKPWFFFGSRLFPSIRKIEEYVVEETTVPFVSYDENDIVEREREIQERPEESDLILFDLKFQNEPYDRSHTTSFTLSYQNAKLRAYKPSIWELNRFLFTNNSNYGEPLMFQGVYIKAAEETNQFLPYQAYIKVIPKAENETLYLSINENGILSIGTTKMIWSLVPSKRSMQQEIETLKTALKKRQLNEDRDVESLEVINGSVVKDINDMDDDVEEAKKILSEEETTNDEIPKGNHALDEAESSAERAV